MQTYDYDLLVVGAGSGGVRAARMAASHEGVRVGIIEDRYWGGTCVNVGCVPKKLYAYGAHFAEDLHDAAGYGWKIGDVSFHWPTLRDNRAAEIKRLNGIYNNLLTNSGVERIEGRGRLTGPNQVTVGDHTYTAERILIATGGWPFIPEFEGAEHCLTSNEVFDLETFPKRFLVYGGGYIAVEFASIFAGLGAESHLVYRGDLFLRGFDQEVREFVHEQLDQKGMKLHFNDTIERITPKGESYQVTLSSGHTLEVDAVLCATGRRPNTQNLGLEEVGVEYDAEGNIRVDATFCTNIPSIYALGDVTGGPQLTPVALEEAMVLTHNLFSGETLKVMDYDNIATAVFCQPNIATVGLSEEEARARYDNIRVYVSRFRPMRNTLANNPEKSLMKLIVDEASDQVIGAHMVGPDAGEIIQGLAIAVKAKLTKADFDATVGIHPTAAEEFVTLRSLTRR
ncbi:glutathione-disulfide reductase [Terasakiispira papahanaumokuakeensis]|uniref:Glutathione-disulfide reductase n=1 Tax=Terasakiispira papahanaumokuakeensis TaxID=197479 RepID=A0A1E2V8R9_9GAMM|nr:glutathione-disulfide reductase [Terasakiispira papahanaumokuakeensis]ODC03381.1 glutathione-disulfide reductase [Terasakiispira papahanaumokuakeensis]